MTMKKTFRSSVLSLTCLSLLAGASPLSYAQATQATPAALTGQPGQGAPLAVPEQPAPRTSAESLDGLLQQLRERSAQADADRLRASDASAGSTSSARFVLESRVQPRASRFLVSQGHPIPVVLLTEVNSDMPGEIVGVVSENVYDSTTGKHRLIPQGTRVLGKYDSAVVLGQERLLFVWTTMKFPDGRTMELGAMPGSDITGAAGATDEVDHKWGKLLKTVGFGALITATTSWTLSRNVPDDAERRTVGQEMAAQTGAVIGQVGAGIIQRQSTLGPTIRLRSGLRLVVYPLKDFVFPGEYAPEY